MSVFFSALGLAVLIHRLGFRSKTEREPVAMPASWPKVSIIVPARNEEENLGDLLPSLARLDYPDYEILVVDDSSSDRTVEIALKLGATVIAAGPKPPGWVGKNWACARGASNASGDLLLFTDADTVHADDGLKRAVAKLRSSKAGLLSAPPYHSTVEWWEKGLGLFQLLPLILTAYRQPPKSDRKYSIGQYLLFTREAYAKIGGHEALAGSLTEDIDLGRAVLERGSHLVVHPEADLYSVRMFDGFDAFARGWTRLLRLGMGKSDVQSVVELLLVFQLFIGPNSALGAALLLAGVTFLLYRQRHFGDFASWGALLFPFSIMLFTGLSMMAIAARLRGKPIEWRARLYDPVHETRSREGA